MSYVDASTRIPFEITAPWHSSIKASFAFHVAGRRYLFVAWPPDTTGFDALCEENFTLYAVGTALEQVADNTYNCDV